jgi:hypothetical protein
MARSFTPGPGWHFELILIACTVLLIVAAVVVALWW